MFVLSWVPMFRFGPICDLLIAPNQTVFVKGRFIMESVVASHEIIHSVASYNQSGFVLKLDYEKAYDMINRDFIFELISSRGFSPQWIAKIQSLLVGGSIGVIVKDANSYFL